jgi:hypothetical protein
VLIVSGEVGENRINSHIGTRTRLSHIELASRNFETPPAAYHEKASTTIFLFSTQVNAGNGTYSSSKISKNRTKAGILPSFRSSFKLADEFPNLDRTMLLIVLPSRPSFSQSFLTNYWRKLTDPIFQDPFDRKASQSIRRTNTPQTSGIKATNKTPRRAFKSGQKSASLAKEAHNNERRGISRRAAQRGHFQASKSQTLG